MSRGISVALAGLMMVGSAGGQPAAYRSASIAAINANPSEFHGELVRVTGTVQRQSNRVEISDGIGALRVLAGQPIPDGDVEIRGTLLDIGRLQRDDSLLLTLNLQTPIAEAYRQRWPKRGEAIVLAVRSVIRQSREIAGIAVTPVPPLPLAVDFSAPIEGEADVRLNARIRLQFSRDVDATSLEDRIRITYSPSDSVERGEAQPPALAFAIRYDPGARALEIWPMQPLERFRPVKVELLEGIVGADGSVLRPWTLKFSTGGS